MYSDIIKNPIVLGVFAGALTYLYLMWTNDKKKNPKTKKEISLMAPIIVTVVVAIIAYAYFNSATSSVDTNNLIQDQILLKKSFDIEPAPALAPVATGNNYHFARDMSTESPASFHLISRGVNIPNNLNIPDIFIETY